MKNGIQVVAALYQRKLLKPVDKFVVVEGEHVLNGVFGVPKQDKKLPLGKKS